NVDVTSAVNVTSVLTQLRTFNPATIQDSGQSWNVQLKSVAFSSAQLNDTKNKITTQQPWASQSANYLTDWYVDAKLNKVVVGLTDVTPQLQQAATSTFGGQVQLVHGERRVSPILRYTMINPRVIDASSSKSATT